MMKTLPGALIGLAVALFLIAYAHHFDTPKPAPVAPAPVSETAPTIVPPPLPAARPAAPPPLVKAAAAPHRRPAAGKKPETPLPWSCATIKFWAAVLPQASIATLERDHHVTAQQRAQAARCFSS